MKTTAILSVLAIGTSCLPTSFNKTDGNAFEGIDKLGANVETSLVRLLADPEIGEIKDKLEPALIDMLASDEIATIKESVEKAAHDAGKATTDGKAFESLDKHGAAIETSLARLLADPEIGEIKDQVEPVLIDMLASDEIATIKESMEKAAHEAGKDVKDPKAVMQIAEGMWEMLPAESRDEIVKKLVEAYVSVKGEVA